MKNTYISLDMLFLDKDLIVLGILENVPTLNEQPRTVNQPAMYVLELNAGASQRLGLGNGDRLKIEGELPRGE